MDVKYIWRYVTANIPSTSTLLLPRLLLIAITTDMASLWKEIMHLIAVSTILMPAVLGACMIDTSEWQCPVRTKIHKSYSYNNYGYRDSDSYDYTNTMHNLKLICTDHINVASMSNMYSEQHCSFYGSQYINTIDITLQDASTLEVSANNELLNNKREVKAVDASFNNITYIPLITNEFHELQRLNCSHNRIVSWTYSDILRFPSLETLDLSYNELDSLEEPATPAAHPNDNVLKLISLHLQTNKIKSIPNRFFRNFNNLQTLDLSYNMISSLEPTTFDGLGKMTYLDMSSNFIINLNFALMKLTRLTELNVNNNKINITNKHEFAGLDSLTTLNINYNKLNALQGLFNSMVSIETLNISHNEITEITEDVLLFNKKLIIVDMSYNSIDSIQLGAFKNNSLITVLEIEGNQLHGALIKGQLEGLTQLKTLNMSHHKLSRIEDFAFFGIQNLSMLNISYNILTLASKYAFKNLNNLKTLDLSYNVLTEITFDTTDLANLQWISLKNNKLSALPSNFTQPLVSLQLFDVSENKILHLTSDTFKSLKQLNNLNVHDNLLTGEIVEKTFHNLKSLPTLDLSHTNISHLQNDSFNGMKTLFNFNISYSNLSRIEYNTFTETGSVLVLDASHNRLEFFSVNNSEISLLEELDLSHNLITHIRSDTLANLQNLKRVYLSNNKLFIVDMESFNTQHVLVFLDLSFNGEVNVNISCLKNVQELSLSGTVITISSDFSNNTDFMLERLTLTSANVTDVESLKIVNLTKLETLDLSSNDISLINNRSFQRLPMLEMLNLHSNKISSIETGSFKQTEELLYLNLSHNEILSLGYGIFSGLRNLLTLDLSYNKIRQINTHKLYDVPLLSYLIIDNNYINTLNFEEFIKTKVATISLGDNFLKCQLLIDHKTKYGLPSDNDNSTSYRRLDLTALSLTNGRENVDGITCKGDLQVHTNRADDYNMSLTEFVYNSEITNKLLEEIKTLLKTSQSINLTTLSSPRDDLKVNKEMAENMTKILTETIISSFPNRTMYQDLWNKFENTLNASGHDNDIQTKIYNEIKKENSHVNDVLNYLYKAAVPNNVTTARRQILHEATAAPSLSDELTTLSNSNLTLDIIITLKDELKEFKNIINEMKGHLEYVTNDSVKTISAELSDRDESAYVKNNPTNIFTEVCVGIILAIVLGLVVYKIYHVKKVLPTIRSMRSTSTQEISNNLEM